MELPVVFPLVPLQISLEQSPCQFNDCTFFGDGNGLTNINPSEVNLDGTDQRLDDLDVSGIGTIATLVVSGVSTFTGDLTIADIIQDKIVMGRFHAPNHLGTNNCF